MVNPIYAACVADAEAREADRIKRDMPRNEGSFVTPPRVGRDITFHAAVTLGTVAEPREVVVYRAVQGRETHRLVYLPAPDGAFRFAFSR